jgi:hypothetical protein
VLDALHRVQTKRHNVHPQHDIWTSSERATWQVEATFLPILALGKGVPCIVLFLPQNTPPLAPRARIRIQC